jgi:membrane-associated phospholipid phosphatase
MPTTRRERLPLMRPQHQRFGPRRVTPVLLLLAAVIPVVSAAQDTDLVAGDVLQYAVPLAALGATWHYDDSEGRWQLLKSYGTTVLATFALKAAFNNTSWGTRPDGGSHSFPSGHTASACSGGFFLQQRYGWEWGAPALAAAVYTGYTREKEGEHHTRDVIAGCALAWGVSKFFVTHHLPEGLSVVPAIGSNSLAVNFSWHN